MKTEKSVFYTKSPTSMLAVLADNPLAFWILNYLIFRRNRGWKYHIKDSAIRLSKNHKTIRKAISLLHENGVVIMEGAKGDEYYSLSDEALDFYMSVDPLEYFPTEAEPITNYPLPRFKNNPSQKMDPPGPKIRDQVVPKNGTRPVPKIGTRLVPKSGSQCTINMNKHEGSTTASECGTSLKQSSSAKYAAAMAYTQQLAKEQNAKLNKFGGL